MPTTYAIPPPHPTLHFLIFPFFFIKSSSSLLFLLSLLSLSFHLFHFLPLSLCFFFLQFSSITSLLYFFQFFYIFFTQTLRVTVSRAVKGPCTPDLHRYAHAQTHTVKTHIYLCAVLVRILNSISWDSVWILKTTGRTLFSLSFQK